MDNTLDVWWMFIYYMCLHQHAFLYEKTIFECKCYSEITVTVSKLALFIFPKLSSYREARNWTQRKMESLMETAALSLTWSFQQIK